MDTPIELPITELALLAAVLFAFAALAVRAQSRRWVPTLLLSLAAAAVVALTVAALWLAA